MDYLRLFGISVYFVFVFQCLSYSQAQEVNECSPRCWTPKLNQRAFGATKQDGITNEDDCKALCLNSETCVALDWDKSIMECWFHTSLPSELYESTVINHWIVANCTNECAPYCWRPVKIGFSVAGGIHQENIKNEAHCKLRCSNRTDCYGIDWDSVCYLIINETPPTNGSGQVHHWDIKRNLSTSCATTTMNPTTTAATTTTVTTSHPTSTKPPDPITTTTKPISTEILTYETSASGTPPSISTNPSNSTSDAQTTDTNNNKKTAAIIGGVVGGFCALILLIILLVVIILVVRKRQRNNKFKEIGHDVTMESGDGKTRPRPIVPQKPKMTSMTKPSTDPVSMTALSSHFASLVSMGRLKQEFDSLPQANYDSCSAAKSSDNASKKNRFKNILPYDATRVKLSVQDNENLDYINANYIQGYDGSQKAYIAAQGPLKTSLSDFWQMIWNEGINRIVMITQLTEQGKSKCDKYWPDHLNDSKEFHTMTVTLIECHVCTDFTKRVMRVEHKENGEDRLVTQLQFTIWNDKGIPTEVYPLLAFRNRVRLLDDEATGPMLVHCSAGVGRTGTFIALDCLLEQSEKTSQASVFGVVKKLREQRMVMVQVSDQYKLLYQAVLEANKTGVTDMDRRSFEKTFSTSNVFPKSLKTSTELEFTLLEDVKRLNDTVHEKSAGLQRENLDKNRSRDTIPDDKVRVYLSPTAHQSDYINAVFTQGHRCPGLYILTQQPLKETIADFWRLVSEHNSPTIVVLEPPDESDELAYWPTETNSTLQFGKISVTLSSKVTSGEILGLELHLKRNGSPPHIVQLYRLSSWVREAELPESATDVLDLIRILSDRHQQLMNSSDDDDAVTDKDRKPVIIVCLDGARKSGLFVAASYLIDKMNNDGSVDPYLSSRYVISSRPQAITSLTQYQYLLHLAAERLHWTPTATIDFAATQATEDVYANANEGSNGVAHPIYANS